MVSFPEESATTEVLNKYQVLEELGRGRLSTVKRAEQHGTNVNFAVKIIPTSALQDRRCRRRSASKPTQTNALLKIRHENIVQLIDIFETDTDLYLMQELVGGGEMCDRLAERDTYSEKDAAVALRQILTGLAHLHAAGITHLDLKPENILCVGDNDSAVYKVADFGLSGVIKDDIIQRNVFETPEYCGPEILTFQRYSTKVDIWSLGVIAYLLLYGFEPFIHEDQEITYQRILRCDWAFGPNPLSESAKDLLCKTIVLEPSKRLSSKQALQHPWIQGRGAQREDMHTTRDHLKEFNAKRKLRGAVHGIMAANELYREAQDKQKETQLLSV